MSVAHAVTKRSLSSTLSIGWRSPKPQSADVTLQREAHSIEATSLTLRRNVIYAVECFKVFVMWRPGSEMKKWPKPRIGAVSALLRAGTMDKVELRSCEKMRPQAG
jgi:hypothetical protein